MALASVRTRPFACVLVVLALLVPAGASSAHAGEPAAPSSEEGDGAPHRASLASETSLDPGTARPDGGAEVATGRLFVDSRPRPAWTGEAAAFGIGLAALMSRDQRIREGVQERRSPSLDRWQLRVEPLGNLGVTSLGALALWGGGTLAGSEYHAESGRIMSESLLLANALDLGTRWMLGRSRPDELGQSGGFFSSGQHAFPSGHAARAFTVATVLRERYGRVAGFVAYPLAAILGLSRVEADAHWASDVFAGAVLGHVVAEYVCRRRGSRPLEDRAVHVMPAVTLGRRPTAGVLLDIRLDRR